jgi:hypothetical protein
MPGPGWCAAAEPGVRRPHQSDQVPAPQAANSYFTLPTTWTRTRILSTVKNVHGR